LAKLFGAARKFWANEDAATMAEYVLMASLIAVACLSAVASLGSALIPLFQSAVTGLS
jgi:Flp pilus assembly pilin Flp